ncbi:hypothetical protein VM98_34570, partial [Streptomyces rubellomurinus subsp. indigoferus]
PVAGRGPGTREGPGVLPGASRSHRYFFSFGASASPESPAMKPSCRTPTRPTIFIRSFPSFAFSRHRKLLFDQHEGKQLITIDCLVAVPQHAFIASLSTDP